MRRRASGVVHACRANFIYGSVSRRPSGADALRGGRLLGSGHPSGGGVRYVAGEVQGSVNQADVRVGLGKVAQLPVGGRVEHFGEEAQVVSLCFNHFVEVIETAVGLAGVYEVAN